MRHETRLWCSHELATDSYPETGESSPEPHILLLEDTF